ncbi:hypothetical protein AB6A40_010510 [Gnathostoma spinigerum]|uniref:Uncharacterized protein n=1 Tax=Gnathostoma spinigerum TaxID=75299 RepID=A0ABD6F199_9BILA
MEIVDTVYDSPPKEMKDMFWDTDVEPLYSEEAAKEARDHSPLVGSTAHITVPDDVHRIVMRPLNEDDDAEGSMNRKVDGSLRRRKYSVVPVTLEDRGRKVSKEPVSKNAKSANFVSSGGNLFLPLSENADEPIESNLKNRKQEKKQEDGMTGSNDFAYSNIVFSDDEGRTILHFGSSSNRHNLSSNDSDFKTDQSPKSM